MAVHPPGWAFGSKCGHRWGLLGPAGRWPQRHGASRFGRADPPRLLAGAQRTRGGVRVVVGTRVTRATAPVGLRRLCPCAGVGVGYTGWTRAQPLEIRVSNAPVPKSHACRTAVPCAGTLELGTQRWTNAHPLEIHARRSPTPVPISNARTHLQRVQAWNSGSIVRGLDSALCLSPLKDSPPKSEEPSKSAPLIW